MMGELRLGARAHFRKHYCDGSLDDSGGAVALIVQHRRRDGEADGRANLDGLLSAKPALASDPRAQFVRLAHDVLLAQKVGRRCVARRRCPGVRWLSLRRTQVDVDVIVSEEAC